MNKTTPWVAAAVALCLPALAQAQGDPADSKSPASVDRYESAFTDYKPWKDIAAGDWHAANKAVGAGATAAGSGALAAPSTPAGTTTPSAAAKPLPAAPAGHEGHHPPGDQK